MPDGSELELDLTTVDSTWTVVEIQRDVPIEHVPAGARDALTAANPEWVPVRIIESEQNDGVVIYEFFGPDEAGDDLKVEVKWEDNRVEVLHDEWQH